MESSEIEKAYRVIIRAYLDNLTPSLKPELQRLLSGDFPEETFLLDFEVFTDGFGDGFPVVLYFNDKHGSQRGGSVNLQPEVLETIPYGLVQTEPPSQEINPPQLAFEELVPWFRELWIAAGGAQCRVPAYVRQHDDIESYDLKQQRWIDDSKKWTSAE